ncbi:Hypothetical protein PHPALM_8872 [Phytophthora palmivora]|uniref:Uncharacterized protein n=1 Tax=Phytophthora palmivora TaxID=4796 RepID=A0A2P4Y8R8_9STRA|nr:Hypothetical protein PHPALM_8872 [Phytophthora palmivora]
MKFMEYRYHIEHIEDPNNVWADMISRWAGNQVNNVPKETSKRRGGKDSSTRRGRNTLTGVWDTSRRIAIRPFDDPGFKWPALDEIVRAQGKYIKARPNNFFSSCDVL